jgi:hypothetical protein
MIRMTLPRLFLAPLTLALLLGAANAPAPAADPDPPLAVSRKSIRVLKEVRESELFPLMNVVSDSLGVHCDYCHERAGTKWLWASDAKLPKAVGREMMQMVLDLNRTRFGGRARVNCYSCHRGATDVPRLVPLPPRESSDRARFASTSMHDWPSTAEVLGRYTRMVGAKSSFVPLTLKGTIERVDNRSGAIEVTVSGDQRMQLCVTDAKGATQVQELDPDTGSVEVQRALRRYAAVKTPPDAAGWNVTGTSEVRGRAAYVVSPADGSVQLFFDVDSGLLLRELRIAETALMPLLDQTDYDDYRSVEGLQLPFVIRTSTGAPYETATRVFTDIRRER